jgi:hypothetical protein
VVSLDVTPPVQAVAANMDKASNRQSMRESDLNITGPPFCHFNFITDQRKIKGIFSQKTLQKSNCRGIIEA